ncbi:helix-turn-helix domain-containing protein [Burkholderia multivorans]|uniref:helix-turn-helix domain-containing protein n=1 Tax=Burkholderia multivorans TaxID=87883 RepID=UPI0021BF3549|nr:helix-turn-helix domain-containing protein [Burkholderia multivorans]HDR9834665.1 helix-turn-helix domain-containing protein [Burkholderia multivorans]HDR9840787.1 helix-turn-helix domain-containing protein [Burkholderia multivorans]HDR9847309.1 helix-turn-helix domain-containing protein [Burkholderia multivorans]HDR9853722.1 helix-turn-helix domain-containing protein [Burkholderia multivorans]
MTQLEELKLAMQAVKLYAESHPRPSHVTQAQAAEMLGVTARTVHTLVRTGKLKLNGLGRIPITQVDELLAARNA